MRRQDRIVAAARDLIGAPFRLHGRNVRTGVDCIGLAVLSLERAGHRRVTMLAPERYSIRGGRPADFAESLMRAGLRRARTARPGDLVLVEADVAQFHLMIATGSGHVHAHAGLGLVVEMPGASPWPVLGNWRWGR